MYVESEGVGVVPDEHSSLLAVSYSKNFHSNLYAHQ
jgi:hypothetical protein